jgi:hypothetical protein
VHVSNNRERQTITFCALPNADALQLDCAVAALFLVVGIESCIRHMGGFMLTPILAGAAIFALRLMIQARASLTTCSATFDGQRRSVTMRSHRPWGASQKWSAAFGDIIDIVENGGDASIVIRVAGQPAFSMPYDGGRDRTVMQAIVDARRLVGAQALGGDGRALSCARTARNGRYAAVQRSQPRSGHGRTSAGDDRTGGRRGLQ